MNSVMSYQLPVTLENVRENKNEAIEYSKSQLNQFKLILLRDALDARGVEYDTSINDYYELQNSLEETIKATEFGEIHRICMQIDKELDDILNELSNGSTDAFF